MNVEKRAPTKKLGKIEIDATSGDYQQVNEDGSKQKLQKAKITLDDCLACSGCVTSAESVLINQQSFDELYKIIENNHKAIQVNSFLPSYFNLFITMKNK